MRDALLKQLTGVAKVVRRGPDIRARGPLEQQLRVPAIAWTTASWVPKVAAANSTLPTKEGAATLPATRTTKRSPRPQSKISSAGTLESEQLSTIANGYWPCASSGW